MFSPKYTITNQLLANITRINELVVSLNNKRFPKVVLMEMERVARAVSSYASTSIEGNPLPLTEVKKILKSQPKHLRESEQEVVNYNQALKLLNTKLESGNVTLSVDLILLIQEKVMTKLLPIHNLGKFRSQPVVVNDPRTGQIVYLPPDAKNVRPLTEDLLAFIQSHQTSINFLILAGIYHKQMVLIHPFIDGNGRTTRLATKVLLAQMGLNTFNLFSFENYYNKNVTRYFQKVGEFGNYYELKDKIDFTKWLEYFTEGIIDELLRVQKLFPAISLSPQTRMQPHHLKILDFIQKKGFITDKDYSKLVHRAKASRTLDFKKLIDLGLIDRKGKGKNTHYLLKT